MPRDVRKWTRKSRTESEIALLPIPAKNKDFLAAAGKPTEEELKALYERGKTSEPEPALPTPGFKQPDLEAKNI